MRRVVCLSVAGLCLLAAGCQKREELSLDLNDKKPDMAEQLGKGEQPSGADHARGLAEGK
ncbi:MAG TPA: hypothetical protein VM328_09310 [Fimbriimonadaceae bacterium]|nr:hypothetical protein [Fimbriimonadaceae bacterium]